MYQGGVDAVAQILRGVDQCAVEIEDEKFERLEWERTKHADHEFSVTGCETDSEFKCDDGQRDLLAMEPGDLIFNSEET